MQCTNYLCLIVGYGHTDPNEIRRVVDFEYCNDVQIGVIILHHTD